MYNRSDIELAIKPGMFEDVSSSGMPGFILPFFWNS
tara:strand:- start:23744 stop:23851 length:108 start_codon:yes stop_codon:yes gene_type:complete